MSQRSFATNFAVGFLIGTTVGAVLSLLYTPEPGEEARKALRKRIDAVIVSPASKIIHNLRWMIMSPRDKYSYLWTHGGSLREWRSQ